MSNTARQTLVIVVIMGGTYSFSARETEVGRVAAVVLLTKYGVGPRRVELRTFYTNQGGLHKPK